jgi:hypothetical protein
MKVATIALAALGLWAAAEASAAPPRGGNRDISCQSVERLPGGNFTFRMRPGLSILALARADGAFRWEHGGPVVGFSCLRPGGMPDVDDFEVLQAGFSLAIGDAAGPLRVIQLELKDGRVTARAIAGTVDAADRRRLDAIVTAMQARIDAAR